MTQMTISITVKTVNLVQFERIFQFLIIEMKVKVYQKRSNPSFQNVFELTFLCSISYLKVI